MHLCYSVLLAEKPGWGHSATHCDPNPLNLLLFEGTSTTYSMYSTQEHFRV